MIFLVWLLIGLIPVNSSFI